MKKLPLLLYTFLLVMIPFGVRAGAPMVSDPQRPYEPLPVNAAIEQEQIYLGELTGDPHLYEVTLSEEKFFSVKLLQLDLATTTPFSFILVRDNGNNRGVSEVGRLPGKEVVWEQYRDPVFALRLKQGLTYSETLAPGVYRFEVSTPDNYGKYLLLLGTEPDESGYFEELGHISTVQRFFGYSSFRLIASSYILYPLGMSLILISAVIVWRAQRRRIGGGNSHA